MLHGLPFINCNSVMSKYSASKYEWKIPSVHIFVGDGFFLSRDSSSSVRMLMPTLDREKKTTLSAYFYSRALFFDARSEAHLCSATSAMIFTRVEYKKMLNSFRLLPVHCSCSGVHSKFHVQCENVSAEEWESWCEFYRHSTRIWKWRRRTKEKKSTQSETV